MNQQEVEQRIAGLEPTKAKAVVCALIGHSRIITTGFGYIYCARCDAQIGDALGSVYSAKGSVIVGHDCPDCRKNFNLCTWVDTFMTQDPFDPEKIAEQQRGREALAKFKKERGL